MKIILFIIISINLFAEEHTNELLYVKKNERKLGNIVETLRMNKKDKRSIYELQERMIKSGEYEFVEINKIQYEASTDKNDLEDAWYHSAIDTQGAWELIDNPQEVIVAVCDSGYEEQHEDLTGQSVPGFNLYGNNDDTSPNTHHGTMVSGLIVGKHSSRFSTSGIAPFLKVMPIKIASKKGSTSTSRIIDCIKYASDNAAKVINVSFTGVENRSIEEAGKYASQRGALLVYSAGNHGKRRKLKDYPDHKNVLIVGGTQQNNKRWNCNKWYKKCGSNYGHFIDLVAPAKSILTTAAYLTIGGDDYRTPNGTSFSAPIVSAVAGMIYSINPFFTPQEVEYILKQSAFDLKNNYVYGEGLVNAKKAVELSLSYKDI